MGQRLTCGYHCTAKPVSFGRGQSAVHTAAYNARTQLEHERENRLTRDYTKHDGEVLFSGIFAPANAPAWTQDREALWNRAEAAERQKVNGQPARNVIVAFPHELDQQQREWLVKDFAREQFARRGMIADVAMHGPDARGDQRNTHAHILLTMRQLDGDSFAKTKCREWNSKEQLDAWRASWAEKGAKALERAGHRVAAGRWRHGHETLAKQRAAAIERGDTAFAESLDREATIHKGAKLTGMERRGEGSDRMDELRGIIDRNEIRSDIKEIERELKALEQAQAEQQKRDEQARADAARAEAERRQAIEKQAAQPKPPEKQPERPVERPYGQIQIDHAFAEKQRQELAARIADANAQFQTNFTASPSYRLDQINAEKAQTTPAATPAESPRAKAPAAHPPQPAPTMGRQTKSDVKAPSGLQVLDGVTGVVTKLGDFVLDFLSGSAPPKPVNMAFTTDPALRKEQQLARVAAGRAAEADQKALESIARDMQTGKALKAEDIRHLTHDHQMQIHSFGDSAVQQMVEDARKRSSSRGYERERD